VWFLLLRQSREHTQDAQIALHIDQRDRRFHVISIMARLCDVMFNQNVAKIVWDITPDIEHKGHNIIGGMGQKRILVINQTNACVPCFGRNPDQVFRMTIPQGHHHLTRQIFGQNFEKRLG
jgi:hypothetical protein